MTDGMDGNLESGDVNKKRSEMCYVIDDPSAQHAPNGLDHTGTSCASCVQIARLSK